MSGIIRAVSHLSPVLLGMDGILFISQFVAGKRQSGQTFQGAKSDNYLPKNQFKPTVLSNLPVSSAYYAVPYSKYPTWVGRRAQAYSQNPYTRQFSSLVMGQNSKNKKEESPTEKKINKWARFFLVASTIASGVTGTSAGYQLKQPVMFLGAFFDFLIWPPMLTKKPSELQGINLISSTVFLTGFANHLDNQYRAKKSDSGKREFSMEPLFKPKALKQQPKYLSQQGFMRNWLNYFKETFKFIIKDYKLVIKDSFSFITAPFRMPPKRWLPVIKKQLKDIGHYIRRPHGNPPAILKPKGSIARLGALFLYLGMIPLIIIERLNSKPGQEDDESKPSPLKKATQWSIGTGLLITNLSKFATGLAERKKIEGKLLLIGVPISIIGGVILNNLGIGLGKIGESAMQFYTVSLGKKH